MKIILQITELSHRFVWSQTLKVEDNTVTRMLGRTRTR